MNQLRPRAVVWALLLLTALAARLRQPAEVQAEQASDYAAGRLDGQGELSRDDLRGEVVLLDGWSPLVFELTSPRL